MSANDYSSAQTADRGGPAHQADLGARPPREVDPPRAHLHPAPLVGAAAARLKKDYWLYAVFNCATRPEAHPVQDPARLGWQPLVKVEHYHVGPEEILR